MNYFSKIDDYRTKSDEKVGDYQRKHRSYQDELGEFYGGFSRSEKKSIYIMSSVSKGNIEIEITRDIFATERSVK